ATISQDTSCAYIASQFSGSQIKFKDINQIDEDDMKEMDIKWNMALLSIRADKFWKKTGKKISIYGSDVAGFDKSKAPKALTAIDGVGCYMVNDDEDHALVVDEVAPTKFALMANTSAESKSALIHSKKKLETLQQEKEAVDGKLAGLLTASKDLDNLVESQRSKKNKEGLGYTAVPPPTAQLYLSPKKDLSWTGLPKCVDDTVTDYSRPSPTVESISKDDQNRNPSETVASPITSKPFIKFVKPKDSQSNSKTDKKETPTKPPVKYAEQYRKPNMKPNIRGNQRNWNNLKSHQLGPDFVMKKKACFNCEIFPLPIGNFPLLVENFPLVAQKDSSQNKIDDKGYWDSGCSRHMTCNISYLSDFEPYDGGYVSFGQGGCKITRKGTIKTGKLEFENVYFVKDLKYNLFSVSQTFDNKNSVLFTDSECIVLGRDFKLLDDANILLRTPRQHNMYSIDLNNIVPYRDLTCLGAKASANECMLWHRRLGHLNFKTMDKLVMHNLVRGLPTKCFENDHTFIACLKGKQHKASWIKREFSNARTPQQNVVAKRRNRTLIEASRTMLADAKLLVTFWAEAVNTACYVQNRVLVNKSHNKTPYELFNGRSPAIGFLKPFGCHVMILNTLDNLGKFKGKGDEGYFIGYSMSSKAFRVFNKRTRRVEENLHVEFLENKAIEKGTKDATSQEVKKDVSSLRYIALPNWAHDSLLEFSSRKPQDHCSTKVSEGSGNSNPTASTSNLPADQMETLTKEDGIFLSQDKYVGDILKKFGYSDVRSSNTPMDKENPWGKDGTRKDVDLHLYRSMIGSLMYLTASRPDIMFAICSCARHQVTPKECHLHAVKRIFSYLKGHQKLGLWYPKESPFDLVSFLDSDYGGATQDCKSTTEYVAAASCCGQVLWFQNQLLDYGHHFIRDCFEKKLISVDHIHTDENVADLLTKPFDAGRFHYLVCKLFPLMGKLSTVSVFLGFRLTFAGTSKFWGILRILMISLTLIPLVSKGFVMVKAG
nr:ribonuclease H-like domain-containing protein [Tanacetum cinerariifolium]